MMSIMRIPCDCGAVARVIAAVALLPVHPVLLMQSMSPWWSTIVIVVMMLNTYHHPPVTDTSDSSFGNGGTPKSTKLYYLNITQKITLQSKKMIRRSPSNDLSPTTIPWSIDCIKFGLLDNRDNWLQLIFWLHWIDNWSLTHSLFWKWWASVFYTHRWSHGAPVSQSLHRKCLMKTFEIMNTFAVENNKAVVLLVLIPGVWLSSLLHSTGMFLSFWKG